MADPSSLRNYDVLVESAPSASSSVTSSLRLVPEATHVGNNRFQVLLKMHTNEYETCVTAGENTNPIIERIVNIVSRQVVPNGRFLRRTETGWEQLSEWQILDFVREQLDLSTGPLSQPGTENAASLHSATLETAKKAEATLETAKRASESVDPAPFLDLDEDLLKALEPLPLPENFTVVNGSSDGDKKRRRRSSLLRRSISESALFFSNITGDKKKSVRIHTQLEESMAEAALLAAAALEEEEAVLDSGADKDQIAESRLASWPRMRSDSFESKRDLVITAEALDVIFLPQNQESTNAVLVPDHTGNNRLTVLMDVQLESYRSALPEQRQVMVQGLQETVRKHWGGRFLMETPAMTYMLLPEEDVNSMLLAALEERAMGSSERSSASARARRPSTVKRETLNAIHEFKPSANVDTDTMRNAARKSLQKRRKRQGLTSKLRNLTFGSRRGLTRSISEPIRPGKQPADDTEELGESFSSLNTDYSSLDNSSSSSSVPVPLPLPLGGRLYRSESTPEASNHRTSLTSSPSKRSSLMSLPELSDVQINDLLSSVDMGDMGSDGMLLPGQRAQRKGV